MRKSEGKYVCDIYFLIQRTSPRFLVGYMRKCIKIKEPVGKKKLQPAQ